MFKNYIKTAIRNLFRHKLFSFINIFGLALGMSLCLVALTVITNTFTYDNFHPFPKRTYRIISDATGDNGLHDRWATSPIPLAYHLQNNFPFIEKTVRVYHALSVEVSFAEKKIQLNGAFTEPSFFDIFGFELAAGDEHTALEKPYTVVLTKEKAGILFPHGNALGKTITIKNYDAGFTVTGILKDGYKTALSNDLYVSFSTLPALESKKKIDAAPGDWKNYSAASTYVLLKENTSAAMLEDALQKIAGTNGRLFPVKHLKQLKYDYQRLDHITPGEALIHGGNAVPASSLWAIGGIAFLILVLACFNYTNLSVARSLTRAREVGVRKVLGGSRKQLFNQFITEAVVVSVFALVIACCFLQPFLSNAVVKERLLHNARPTYYAAVWFIPFAVFSGLLAGSLPAWILSAFKPVDVMKGILSVKLFSSIRLHKALIALQFSISLLFTILLLTIHGQVNYLKNFSYGFNQKDIINIPVSEKNIDVLKGEIAKIPGVERISAISDPFGFHTTDYLQIKKARNTEGIQTDSYFIDKNVIENMKLDLVSGTVFPETDRGGEAYVILNEKAVRNLQFHNSREAVGQLVWLNDSTPVQVAGVVKDFNYMNPKHAPGNLALRYNKTQLRYLNVKVSGHRDAIPAALRVTWRKLYGSDPFTYTWFNEELREGRDKPEDFAIIAFLSLMAITISCMGLLGIVTYSSQVRQKEVGIRKVMGAGLDTILLLLSKDFVVVLIITSLITLPLGYMISTAFLHQFAFRITAGWQVLVPAVLIIMLVGLLAIIPQTLKIALINPAKSLRTE